MAVQKVLNDVKARIPRSIFVLAYHSDSLDIILYVRFAIQNLEFYEWKLGDRGWVLS